MENIFCNFSRQDWGNKELIVVLNLDELSLNGWRREASNYNNIKIIQIPENLTLGYCLNEAVRYSKGEFISKMDDDDFYSSFYLSSSYRKLVEKQVDVIGKTSIYMYFENEENMYVFNPYLHGGEYAYSENTDTIKSLMGGTLLFKKFIAEQTPFLCTNVGEDVSFCTECIKKGYKLFSSDKTGYVYIRRDESLHTWGMKNQKLKKFCTLIGHTKNYEEYASKNISLNN